MNYLRHAILAGRSTGLSVLYDGYRGGLAAIAIWPHRSFSSEEFPMRKSMSLFIVAIAVTSMSGTLTAAAPTGKAQPNRIRIEYVSPKNPAHQMLYDMLKESRVLETLQQIFSPLRLSKDLTIKTL
jgi:hypothetical protein